MSESLRRNRGLFLSEQHDWQTPWYLFFRWHKRFRFTVDAAASHTNHLLDRYWTKEDDALLQDWTGERVWCNPPYGKEQIGFIEKAAAQQAEISVLLIPARTDTKVWHDLIFPLATIEFLRGRINFTNPRRRRGGVYSGKAPFASALVIFEKGG